MERVILKLEDGRTITVTVAQVEHGKCRLGFDAPPGVVILREELLPPTPAYSKES